jgi:preprotein translocase subunit SecB
MSMQPAPEGAPAEAPQLRVLSQFVKELSFQNALAGASARAYEIEPTIDMGVEVKSRPIGEAGEATEVDLCIKVVARRGEEPMFSVNLVYSGLFQFVNAHPQDIEPLIWIECPRLLFPFSRQVLAEITREGGYPPIMLNPIDFAPLYWAEQQDRQARAAGGVSF